MCPRWRSRSRTVGIRHARHVEARAGRPGDGCARPAPLPRTAAGQAAQGAGSAHRPGVHAGSTPAQAPTGQPVHVLGAWAVRPSGELPILARSDDQSGRQQADRGGKPRCGAGAEHAARAGRRPARPAQGVQDGARACGRPAEPGRGCRRGGNSRVVVVRWREIGWRWRGRGGREPVWHRAARELPAHRAGASRAAHRRLREGAAEGTRDGRQRAGRGVARAVGRGPSQHVLHSMPRLWGDARGRGQQRPGRRAARAPATRRAHPYRRPCSSV